METFAEVRQHIIDNHKLFIDEPFQLAFDCPMEEGERTQAIYIAELKASDNRRTKSLGQPPIPTGGNPDLSAG